MDKPNDVNETELTRLPEATKDLEPNEQEADHVIGGSFSWGISSGGDRPSES